jgi:hypothetical protein
MTIDELDGDPLAMIALSCTTEEAPRDALYRALLEHPVAVTELGPGAPAGPTVRIGPSPDAQAVVRLVEAPRLGAPVVALYTSGKALEDAARERNLWPDGVMRAVVFERGEVFPLLRGHPGALVVTHSGQGVPLDAGEVSALADRLSPEEFLEQLRKLVTSGRPLYTLGHPHGGPLIIGLEFPVFLHLGAAERFARKIHEQSGQRVEQATVAAAELFKLAVRGKLTVLLEPGPKMMRLKWADLR